MNLTADIPVLCVLQTLERHSGCPSSTFTEG
jgi:hypothetical protein